MIYFLCPYCKDDLEVEDDARGEEMECPSCDQEIQVPEKGLDIKKVRQEAPKKPVDGSPGSKFLLIVLVTGALLVGGGLAGAFFLLAPGPVVDTRPACGSCAATGKTQCGSCQGSKQLTCGKCQGTGAHKNVQDEPERCYQCSATGKIDCKVCAGRGFYSCRSCGGTGRQGGSAPPLPEGTP